MVPGSAVALSIAPMVSWLNGWFQTIILSLFLLWWIILASFMIPVPALIVNHFIIIAGVKLLNSHIASSCRSIPRDFREAAVVDGANWPFLAVQNEKMMTVTVGITQGRIPSASPMRGSSPAR